MADRPIIFSAPMVRALLDGRKTQTRRIIKPQPMASGYYDGDLRMEQIYRPDSQDSDSYVRFSADAVGGGAIVEETIKLPYAHGDRLYVREAHKLIDQHCDYRADWPEANQHRFRWRPSIHMPRSASRLTLTVTDVRVQRLQEIGEADAVAEGIEPYAGLDPDCHGFINYQTKSEDGYWLSATDSFRTLWANLHGPDAWGANPWVVALTFTVQHGNIDQMEAGHG